MFSLFVSVDVMVAALSAHALGSEERVGGWGRAARGSEERAWGLESRGQRYARPVALYPGATLYSLFGNNNPRQPKGELT